MKVQIVFFCLLFGTTTPLTPLFAQGDQKYASPHGEAYTTTVPTPVILDNLLARELLPPLVAVFVGNAKPYRRNEELSCNVAFADFLSKELVPWVRHHYRVTTDPKQTIVAGSSLGGAAASFTALRHPDIFGNVLSQSGVYSRNPKMRIVRIGKNPNG